MLEANRASRLAEEQAQRKRARKLKLEQIMDDIKAADPLLVDISISPLSSRSASDSNAPVVQVSHRRLFPLVIDLLEYPIIKSLEETDVPASEMERHLEGHREEIKAHLLKWRVQTEGLLAELLRQGRVSDGLEKAAPVPKLPVQKSEPNPFNGVSDDLKLLLRADSLFESGDASDETPYTYDTRIFQRIFAYMDDS